MERQEFEEEMEEAAEEVNLSGRPYLCHIIHKQDNRPTLEDVTVKWRELSLSKNTNTLAPTTFWSFNPPLALTTPSLMR